LREERLRLRGGLWERKGFMSLETLSFGKEKANQKSKGKNQKLKMRTSTAAPISDAKSQGSRQAILYF
jgi:hypothetical protein